MIDWTPLEQELDACARDGHVIDLWWRDDDAIQPTEALDRLVQMAEAFRMPLHLAIIPSGMTTGLVERLSDLPDVVPMVHGWQHLNHEPKGRKKCEFGDARSPAQLEADVAAGRRRLHDAFGDRLSRIFVPPWNRIMPDAYVILRTAGYRAVSQFGPRAAPFPTHGLEQINTHLDPVHWKGNRGLVDPHQLVQQTAEQIRQRRLGEADNREPYGLLTHHLVQDDATWGFCQDWLQRMTGGPCRFWRADMNDGDTYEPT